MEARASTVPTTRYDDHRRMLWRDKAQAYDRTFAALCAYPVPTLLTLAEVGPGTRVLDVGCGSGTATALAVERGARTAAVDAEPSMVTLTSSRSPSAGAVVGALPQLPFTSRSFDVVVSNFVINHVQFPLRCVRELHRLVRPGGLLAVSIWPSPPPQLQRLWGEVIEAAGVISPPTPSPSPDDDFERTADGLHGLLSAAGLSDVACELLRWEHRVDQELWWSGPLLGVASIGHVVSHQDEVTVARMKQHYDRLSARFLGSDGLLHLPTSAVIAVGRVRSP